MIGLLSPILRNASGGRLIWWCPGCGESHQIAVGDGPGPRWGWNGNAERPTFTPSVLVTGIRRLTDEEVDRIRSGELVQPEEVRCHSFVVDGQMQMLADCTHALAGQTVPIPPWPTPEPEASC